MRFAQVRDHLFERDNEFKQGQGTVAVLGLVMQRHSVSTIRIMMQ